MDAAIFSGVSAAERDRLTDLCRQFNAMRDKKLMSCAVSDLAYDALDLDLGTILVQVLPILLGLFTGGMTLPAILGLVKVLVSLLIKDSDLATVVTQILETLLGFLVKK